MSKTCVECETATCHRTRSNPYCSALVYTICSTCKRRVTVRGDHECEVWA